MSSRRVNTSHIRNTRRNILKATHYNYITLLFTLNKTEGNLIALMF